jgi:serine/threonine protein kinase
MYADNVLLDGDGNCVLCDFGISKIVSDTLGQATPRAGTPNYM